MISQIILEPPLLQNYGEWVNYYVSLGALGEQLLQKQQFTEQKLQDETNKRRKLEKEVRRCPKEPVRNKQSK